MEKLQNVAGKEKQFSERKNLVKILKKNFGHSEFRENQLEAIEAVMSENDCVCIMPTGGGKSMCYQIPALAKTGIVLVVCPLIGECFLGYLFLTFEIKLMQGHIGGLLGRHRSDILFLGLGISLAERMKNQVMALKEKGIAAEYLFSKQKSSIRKKINEDLDSVKPSLRLLYVTPELIATPRFMAKLITLNNRDLLNLIAIDEAHCISTWGHDFRPCYSQLSALRNNLPGVPVLALTATAVPKVEKDVIDSLCLQQPLVLRSSLNRPNIFYEVRNKDHLDVYADLSNRLSGDVCSIVYCLKRTTCDDLSARLLTHGISCAAYHEGLDSKLRSSNLDDWLSSKIQVVVATNAIGMAINRKGIDRKDVRIVCHYNIPKSMEFFYQESGRAGCDQKLSRSLLYYGRTDHRKMEFFLKKEQQSSRSQDNGSSKKSLESFKQMVEYCKGSTCRRMKLLKSFGEQASASLCRKTCDACEDRETISEAMRDSWRRKLLNSLKQAEQRVGTLKIEFEAFATSLENECFKKYGEVGRTLYDPEVASTVNWLSTSSSMEISNRVGSNTTPNCDTHMQECVPTTSSLPSVIPGEQSQVPIIVIPDEESQVPVIVIPDEESQVPTEVTKEESCGNPVSETLLNNPEMKTPSHIELPPIPIPSFAAEFVTGKVKGRSNPSSTSNKHSISRTHKDAEKKMRL